MSPQPDALDAIEWCIDFVDNAADPVNIRYAPGWDEQPAIARAYLATLRASRAQAGGVVWHEGCPPHPYDKEWFIAQTAYDDRVVLIALPEENSFDYKTADETYIKREKIKRWMQFPDSEYKDYAAAPAAQGEAWRAIAEAPRDGTIILLAGTRGVWPAKWADNLSAEYYPWAGWRSLEPTQVAHADKATHFRPLPAPPYPEGKHE